MEGFDFPYRGQGTRITHHDPTQKFRKGDCNLLPDTNTIRTFFEQRAHNWDETCTHDPKKIAAIVSLAGIHEGDRIVDIACGTGILFDQLLSYAPSELVGLDLSPAMIAKAQEKFTDPRLRLLAQDFLEFEETGFQLATLYSAYPHFPDKERLARKLWEVLAPSGRLMLAHSQSRHIINGRHDASLAKAISVGLRPVNEESQVFSPYFELDILADTPDFYIISGTRRDAAVPFQAQNA